jgi:hypothetical protein
MSLRRSARIAAKNASKASSNNTEASKNTIQMVLQTNPDPSFLLGPGSQGKSLFPLFLRETSSPISSCHIEYVIFPTDADIENPQILQELIARHEMRSEFDRHRAMRIYTTEWEVEMHVASHWLCIDSRILKASPEMFKKAEVYGHKVNDLFPALYAKLKSLDDIHWRLKGIEGDHAQRERLWTSVLRQVAHHAHDKWNNVWNQVQREKMHRQEDFKPEMGWSSDEEY